MKLITEVEVRLSNSGRKTTQAMRISVAWRGKCGVGQRQTRTMRTDINEGQRIHKEERTTLLNHF